MQKIVCLRQVLPKVNHKTKTSQGMGNCPECMADEGNANCPTYWPVVVCVSEGQFFAVTTIISGFNPAEISQEPHSL